jgi:hypothetical protein
LLGVINSSWYRNELFPNYRRGIGRFSEADLEAEALHGTALKAPQQGTALKAPHARTRGGPLSRHGLWLFLAILKQTFTAAVALDDLL